MLWVLYVGGGRARVAQPLSLNERIPLGDDSDAVSGAPLDRAVAAVRNFLRLHGGWSAILSVPHRFDVPGVSPVRELAAGENAEVSALMQLPLGEWADASRTRLFLLEGGSDA